MPKIMVLTDEWKHWLEENARLGCSEASMVDSMCKADVDAAIALQWARQALAATGPAAPTPSVAVAAGAYRSDVIRLPQTGNVIRTADRDVRVGMRMSRPVIAIFDNLLSNPECDELMRLASIRLKRSTIVDPQSGAERLIDDRSSHGTYFLREETEFIARIDRRIAQTVQWPAENGEGLQILRYGVGGEYKPHFDYFEPNHPGSGIHLARGGQRVSTLILYLNDVEQGGETVFPSAGLRVVPRKGSAVYFEYCNASGQVDVLTLHGGTPVEVGEKWIATKWMRQGPYR